MRHTSSLLDGWQFQIEPGTWTEITLPHTYNAIDGTRGGPYYRGKALYRRPLPAVDDGRRQFVHFEGCSLIAKVSVSGSQLKEHRGGYTGFYVEIPAGTKTGEWLEVEVDNAKTPDIAPLSGDFNIYGGIYRAVQHIATGTACFTPTSCGTDGVQILDQKTTAAEAIVKWSAAVSSPGTQAGRFEIRVAVKDATAQTVANSVHPIDLSTGASEVVADISVLQPNLWQGKADPYLYTFVWELVHDHKVVDRVERRMGLRSIAIGPNGGILLNGQPIVLRGACKHQDIAVKASAISHQDIDRDFEFLTELGANAVRLAHYPHSKYTYEVCDRLGLLAWAEIPMVNDLKDTPEFRDTTTRQFREMIGQLGHHACVFTWGIFNELYGSKSDRSTELVEALNAEAKRLDPSRPTTCAGFHGTPQEIRTITDLLATNAYPGWYEELPADMGARIKMWDASGGHRGLCVSEYGAGGNPWHHEEPPAGQFHPACFWHPEEWQCAVHEGHYEAILDAPEVWGSFIWVLFDFYSDYRKEGGLPGVNDKGLVTADRSIKKDVFYYYKAHWSDTPVLHIASKRNYKPLTAPKTIRVYSNLTGLTAKLNEQELPPPREVARKVYEFDLPALVSGPQKVEVFAKGCSDIRSDTREFIIA